MNIFPLDTDIKTAAKYNCDKHVNKIILEIAQMLSSAFKDIHVSGIYKPAYFNHPMTIWARTSQANFKYMVDMAECLNVEKQYRFGSGDHASIFIVRYAWSIHWKIPFPEVGLTKMPQCMPDEYKCEDHVIAYRNYYIGEKSHLAKWTGRSIPKWFIKKNTKMPQY